ncbi:hypothetical protein F8M41_023017 [Gigaspora margarita]|uniref:CCHC-type domain-containing protein n=1 Tax=Gigaspora margarita TaxID=4874 RepID=A0A8H4AE49_GIGMA|nr:hypothetical protein F8M41_023017 [Gigaspora margarita]
MAKQTQIPASQTVKPVRQPKGPPPSLQTEEGIETYNSTQYLNNLGIFSTEDFEKNYPIKPFQRSLPQRSNVSARIDRVEEGINETRDAVNQLTNQFQKVYIGKCDICGEMGHSKKNCPNRQIARSNFKRSAYFKPLIPINFQNTPPGSDNEEDGYDEENNRWTVYDTSEKKTDTGSEFSAINDPAIYALGWKIDEPSDFAIKGNSKHITDSLGWYTDVPVTLKDKENKTVTIIKNFVRIDNGEPEPMLFLDMSNIRKLQGTPEPNKNQFRIKLYGKTYVIPTYSKNPIVKESPKDTESSKTLNSDSSSEELKKNA